jgi:hypothetical protein
VLAVGLALAGCGGAPETGGATTPAAGHGTTGTDPVFAELGAESGLDFVHVNGATGSLNILEVMGAGGGLVDYDRDGDLDLYLVQGGALPFDRSGPATGSAPGDRLYRNDLEVGSDGTRRLRFTDVTDQAGLRATGYGMGVATGDADGDGWTDLYVTNYGPNQLWRNRGDGTFEDVTERSGTGDPRWSVSATFFDADRDGDLDLYVADYIDLTDHQVPCFSTSSAPDYCGPSNYPPQPDRLYRNRGDGTFEDVTAAAQIARAYGPGLGVVAADLDGDGWQDLYVANDAADNQLWINRRDGTFRDAAVEAGCAVNGTGEREGSMGIACGDPDDDGDLDLLVTHFDGETSTFYVNRGDGTFADRSNASGLGRPSWDFTAFGTSWLDVGLDGRLDLVVVSGAVKLAHAFARPGATDPLAQPGQLFLAAGDGRFAEAPAAELGEGLARREVRRGAALGDVDGDGDVDVLVTANGGPARLLLDRRSDGGRWLGVRAVTRDGRDALGALVGLHRAGRPTLWRRAAADGSYASASDPRVVFGLGSEGGDGGEPLGIEVRWPDGTAERWADLAPGTYHTLAAGSGRPAGPSPPRAR